MKKNLLVFSLCAIVLFTGCFGSKKESSKTASDVKIVENKTDDLEAKTYFTKNNEVIFEITNKGKDIVDYVNIDVAFYDNNGNLMKTEKKYFRNIVAGTTNYAKLSLGQMDEKGNTTLPAKIEFALNKTAYSTKFEDVYTDKVSGAVEKSENEGELNLTINNTSGQKLDDVTAAVVFYKDSKPVDVQTFSFQNVDTTASQQLYVSTVVDGETTKMLDYDDAKVVINNASKYISQ